MCGRRSAWSVNLWNANERKWVIRCSDVVGMMKNLLDLCWCVWGFLSFLSHWIDLCSALRAINKWIPLFGACSLNYTFTWSYINVFSLILSLFREPIPCSLFTACQLLAGRFLHTQLRNMRPNQVAQCLCHLETTFAAVGAAGFAPQFSTQLQSWGRQLTWWSFLVIARLHFFIVKYKNNYKYVFFFILPFVATATTLWQ